MIDILDPILDNLSDISGLSGKIFFAETLKNASPPFAFIESTGAETFQALDGYTELESVTFNLHIVSSHIGELNELSGAAKRILIGMQGSVTDGFLYERLNLSQISPVLHEREVGLFRKVFNVIINYQQL